MNELLNWQEKTMGLLGGIAYIALGLVVGYSALKHRGEGWRSGALLALLILTLPGWVFGLLWLFVGFP